MSDDGFRRNPPVEDNVFNEDEFQETFDETNPDDGFMDENFVEGETGEEDWGTFDENAAGVTEDGFPAEKKKSSLFNILLIGGAVVACLAVGYMKFGGGGGRTAGTGAAPVADTATQRAFIYDGRDDGETADAGATDSGVKDDAASKGGFLNDPGALENLDTAPVATGQEDQLSDISEPAPPEAMAAEPVARPPMPAPITTAEPSAASGDVLTPLPDLGAENEPAPSPTAPPPQAATMPLTPAKAPASAMKADASLPVPSNPSPAPAAGTAGLDAKLDALLSRLESMEGRLSGIESTQAGREDVTALRTAVDDLRSRLDRVEQRPGGTAPVAASQAGLQVRTDDMVSVPIKAKPKARPRTATAETTALRWTLKSAQPGQAYVSRPGQNDMFSVRVGDTLAGIGTVQSISSNQGRWVIQGTDGQVAQ